MRQGKMHCRPSDGIRPRQQLLSFMLAPGGQGMIAARERFRRAGVLAVASALRTMDFSPNALRCLSLS